MASLEPVPASWMLLTYLFFYFQPLPSWRCLVASSSVSLLLSVIPLWAIICGSTASSFIQVCISNSHFSPVHWLCFSKNAGYGSVARCTTWLSTYFKLHVIKPRKVTLGVGLPFIYSCRNDCKLGGKVKDGEWINIYSFPVKAMQQISVSPFPGDARHVNASY